MWIHRKKLLLLCLLLNSLPSFSTSVDPSLPLKSQQVLVIHNLKHFQTTHLDILRVLNNTFNKVFVYDTKSVRKKLFERGQPKYHLVIIIAPRYGIIYQLMRSIKLLKFFDEAGSVLLLGSANPSAQFRKLLNFFGFDLTTHDNTHEINPKYVKANFSHIQQTFNNPWVTIPKKAFLLQSLANDMLKGIHYKGTSISLSIYDNDLSWPLLLTPHNSYLHFLKNKLAGNKFDMKRKVLDPDRNSLIAGAQKADSMSRIMLIGSMNIFSNESVQRSEGDNLQLFKNVLQWLQFKQDVLTIDFFKVCADTSFQNDDQNSEGELLYKSENKIRFRYQFPTRKFYIKYSMSLEIYSYLEA